MPFVSIEGIDGSGKTEQVARLVERLKGTGRRVLQTKEPDGGHLGAEIRAILTRPGRELSAAEQLLLVSAARCDHVRSVIRPALTRGDWVVSDRFLDSTFAFQVATTDVDLMPLLHSVNGVVVGKTLPEVTIIIDIPLEIAAERRGRRMGDAADPAEALRDFSRIREGLIAVAAREPRRCRIVNGDQPPGEVERDIWRELEALL